MCDLDLLLRILLLSLSLALKERAFLGISTLKELVLRRPQGPSGTEDFLQALLEITISDIELVRNICRDVWKFTTLL